MMKRCISLMTSLLMTVSLFGGSVASVAAEEQIPVLGAVNVSQPVLKLMDTSVFNGEKKVSVPVVIDSGNIAGMKVSLKVTSNQENESQPKITGITKGEVEGYVDANEKIVAENERSFTWHNMDVTDTKFEKQVVAYVEVQLPSTAVTGSTYTLSVTKSDVSDAAQTEGNMFTDDPLSDDDSDFTATISVIDNVAIDGFITSMNDNDKVKRGSIVKVPMYVVCPEKIAGMVADFSVSGDASITGFDTKDSAFSDYFMAGEKKPNKIEWVDQDNIGADLTEEGVFVNVFVKIPDDAKPGDQYKIKLDKLDVSDLSQQPMFPQKYASAVLTVAEEQVKADLTVEIASEVVSYNATDNKVALPVYISHDATLEGICAVVAKFDITNKDGKKATIESITNGSDVPSNEVMTSEAINKAEWNNEDGKNTSFTLKENGDRNELFILNIALPDDRAAGDVYNVNFASNTPDIANSNQMQIIGNYIDGSITIVKPDDIVDAYKIAMDDLDIPATGKIITAKIPVYLDGADINSFTGTFAVSNGAVIKSISSVNYKDEISTSDNNNNTIIWQGAKDKNTKFDTTKSFVEVEVQIPADRSYKGNQFVVTVQDVKSLNADNVAVYPVTPYGAGVITLTEPVETEKPVVTLDIDEVEADSRTSTVSVPVRVNASALKSIAGTFTFKCNDDNTDINDYVTIKGYRYISDSDVNYISTGEKNPNRMVWTLDDSSLEVVNKILSDDFIEMIVELKNVPESVDIINIDFTNYTAGVLNQEKYAIDADVVANDGSIRFKNNIEPTDGTIITTTRITKETDTTISVPPVSEITSESVTTVSGETPVTTVSGVTPVTTVSDETPVTTVSGVTPVTTVSGIAPVTTTGKVTPVTTTGSKPETSNTPVTTKKPVTTAVTFNPVTTVSTSKPITTVSKITSVTAITPVTTVTTHPATSVTSVPVTTITSSYPGTTVSTAPVTTKVTGPYVSTTPVTTVVTGPYVSTVPVTTDVTGPDVTTTPVTTDVTGPDVTTTPPVTTTHPGEVTLPTDGPHVEPLDPEKGLESSLGYTSNPAFYFSYEKDFDIKEKATLIVNLYEDGKLVGTIDLIGEGYVTVEGTPAEVYDGKNFKYKLKFIFNAPDNKIKEYDASAIAAEIDKISFTAYIGQRGDITLNHMVDARDATAAVKEYSNQMLYKKSILSQIVADANLPDGLFEAVNDNEPIEIAEQFAAFLGDSSINDTTKHVIDARDCTFDIRYYNIITILTATGKPIDSEKIWAELEGEK